MPLGSVWESGIPDGALCECSEALLVDWPAPRRASHWTREGGLRTLCSSAGCCPLAMALAFCWHSSTPVQASHRAYIGAPPLQSLPPAPPARAPSCSHCGRKRLLPRAAAACRARWGISGHSLPWHTPGCLPLSQSVGPSEAGRSTQSGSGSLGPRGEGGLAHCLLPDPFSWRCPAGAPPLSQGASGSWRAFPAAGLGVPLLLLTRVVLVPQRSCLCGCLGSASVCVRVRVGPPAEVVALHTLRARAEAAGQRPHARLGGDEDGGEGLEQQGFRLASCSLSGSWWNAAVVSWGFAGRSLPGGRPCCRVTETRLPWFQVEWGMGRRGGGGEFGGGRDAREAKVGNVGPKPKLCGACATGLCAAVPRTPLRVQSLYVPQAGYEPPTPPPTRGLVLHRPWHLLSRHC